MSSNEKVPLNSRKIVAMKPSKTILAEIDNSHVNSIFREFSISDDAQFYPWHFIKLKSRSTESFKEAVNVEENES